ncbi:hypothetical protein E3N88_19556 [Mikania micrantha]|uniref:Uncharacterized protein n=1 Tax=Mikania micrantha TaxID=192012 RepID=A0A5N6NQ74_9ASTR|nr:hypothetical protein E3N88_19556 [Mikania micrantha]
MAATTRNSIIAAQLSTISVRLDAILTSLKEDTSAIKTQMIGNGCYSEKTNDDRKNTTVEDCLKADKRDELINSDNMKDCHQILEFKSDKQIHHKGSMVFEDGGDGDQEEEDEASDSEGDGSNPDLAWKLLDERSIVEKQSSDIMEKVNILSALAKVALEREDVDISLNDYLKALSMLERLAEPDSIRIAKLNFRICLCLKLGPNGSGFHPVLKSLMGNFSGGLEMYEDGDIFWNKDVKAELKLRDLNFVDSRTSRFSMGDVLIQTRVTKGFDLVKLSGQKWSSGVVSSFYLCLV